MGSPPAEARWVQVHMPRLSPFRSVTGKPASSRKEARALASFEAVVKLHQAGELDDHLRPKLVASLSGQGGESNIAGIEVPVRVKGAWDDPKITPDLNGVLADPDKVTKTVNELSKK